MVGGDETNFEGALGRLAFFRVNCRNWTSVLESCVQDGNKIAGGMCSWDGEGACQEDGNDVHGGGG